MLQKLVLRNFEIYGLNQKGLTNQEIADRYNLKPKRIQQIVAECVRIKRNLVRQDESFDDWLNNRLA